MATSFPFNYDLGPKQAQGTSIGDMVNLARGVQAYQQAEQLNPLQVETAREQAAQAKLGTQAKGLELNDRQTGILYGLAGGVLNDPRIRSGKKEEVTAALQEAKDRASTYQIPQSVVDGVFTPLFQGAEKAPGKMPDILKNIIQTGIGPSGQQGLQTPQLVSGPNQAPALLTPGTGALTPATIGQQAAPQAPQGAPQGAPAQPSGVTPTQMQLSYPIRRAGDIRPMAPNEQIDQEKGASYRNGLTTRQTDLATARRNLDEVIKEAGNIQKEDLFSSGALGALTRTVKGFIGDPKYKQLSKDLANVQIANIQAQGGSMDTVAGQQLQRMANGDETFPPEVLINIARRTYADLTNLDMQATAASKFAQKYGDANLNTFKRLWSSNADSKVFEAMSIYQNVKDPEKRKQEIDRLLGSNPEKRQEFFQKYNNIKKLTETGEL